MFLSLRNSLKKGVYPPRYIRILLCLFVGSFFVIFGEEDSFQTMFHNYGFYLSELGSCMIAIIMSEFISFANRYCDKHFPWRNNLRKRIWLRGTACVVLSVLLGIALASFYFILRNTTITLAGYFKYDFVVVICFVIIVNGYYLGLNLLQLKNTNNRKNLSNYKLPPVPTEGPTAPAIIFTQDKANVVLLFNKAQFGWEKTLIETIKELPFERYFLINRSHIVHWAIISHYEPYESNTLKLFLLAPFDHLHPTVAQRRVVDFKEWFEREIKLKMVAITRDKGLSK